MADDFQLKPDAASPGSSAFEDRQHEHAEEIRFRQQWMRLTGRTFAQSQQAWNEEKASRANANAIFQRELDSEPRARQQPQRPAPPAIQVTQAEIAKRQIVFPADVARTQDGESSIPSDGTKILVCDMSDPEAPTSRYAYLLEVPAPA